MAYELNLAGLPAHEEIIERVVVEYRDRAQHWAPRRQRIEQIDALVGGQWGRVFPDDVNENDLPMVENLFRMTVEDGGRLFAEQVPTERVPRAKHRDETAEQKEGVLLAYTMQSELYDFLAYPGMDLIAAGVSGLLSWVDYDPHTELRMPIMRRVDPRVMLLEKGARPDRKTESVITHRKETLGWLRKRHPAQAFELEVKMAERDTELGLMGRASVDTVAKNSKELTILEWWGIDYVCRVAVDDLENRVGKICGVVLVAIPNEVGLCPLQPCFRETWTREPLGQLDDSKGIVRTRNRYYRLLTDYFVQMVYGEKLVWNVKNANQKGPGVKHYALGPDAFEKPIAPEMPNFQVWQVLAGLDDAARGSMVAPRSRQGEVELNKASAAFLSRAQGQLNSVVRSLQRQYAVTKRRANEVCFALDEWLCNEEKTVTSRARGRRMDITYTPKDLIAGDYANVVTYGTSSGLDKPTDNVLRLEKMQGGVMSRETFLETDPDVEDAGVELSRLSRQSVEDGVRAELVLATGDLALKLEILKAYDEGKTTQQIVEMVLERQQQQAEQQQLLAGQQSLGMAAGAAGGPGAPAPAPGPGGAPPPSGPGPSGVPGAQAPVPLPPLPTVRRLVRQGR